MILCLKPLSSYNEIDFPFASPLLPALLHTQAGSPWPHPLRFVSTSDPYAPSFSGRLHHDYIDPLGARAVASPTSRLRRCLAETRSSRDTGGGQHDR